MNLGQYVFIDKALRHLVISYRNLSIMRNILFVIVVFNLVGFVLDVHNYLKLIAAISCFGSAVAMMFQKKSLGKQLRAQGFNIK